MTRVNTLVIGAQKSGTTSFCEYLKQHPDVAFSAVKELTWFVDDTSYARGPDEFHQYFAEDADSSVVATSYVHMLSSGEAASRAHGLQPGHAAHRHSSKPGGPGLVGLSLCRR